MLLQLFLSIWCVLVVPCFLDDHETMRNILRIALNQPQKQMGIGLDVWSKQTPAHVHKFFLSNISCWIWLTRSFEKLTVLTAISYIFNTMFPNTRSWTCIMLSSVVAVFGAPGQGLTETYIWPRWNLWNQFLSIAVEREDSSHLSSLWFPSLMIRDICYRTKLFCCSFSLPIRQKTNQQSD